MPLVAGERAVYAAAFALVLCDTDDLARASRAGHRAVVSLRAIAQLDDAGQWVDQMPTPGSAEIGMVRDMLGGPP